MDLVILNEYLILLKTTGIVRGVDLTTALSRAISEGQFLPNQIACSLVMTRREDRTQGSPERSELPSVLLGCDCGSIAGIKASGLDWTEFQHQRDKDRIDKCTK